MSILKCFESGCETCILSDTCDGIPIGVTERMYRTSAVIKGIEFNLEEYYQAVNDGKVDETTEEMYTRAVIDGRVVQYGGTDD